MSRPEHEQTQRDDILEGRNVVWEALKADRPIDRLLLSRDAQQQALRAILGNARQKKIKIEFAPREKLDKLSPTGRHQGIIAFAAARDYADLDTVLDDVAARGEPPLLVLLDEVQDPHNLGAIIRTAECAGAHAVVIPARNSAGLTAAAERASAGAAAHIPVCRVGNLVQAMGTLKARGIWLIGADMDGRSAYQTDMKAPTALVIGSEGCGLRRLVREQCDAIAALPMRGRVNSLNASVAAGVLLYEAVRQRMAGH